MTQLKYLCFGGQVYVAVTVYRWCETCLFKKKTSVGGLLASA